MTSWLLSLLSVGVVSLVSLVGLVTLSLDFGILIHSGLSVRRAVLLNLASASVAILGAVAALLLGAVSGAAVTMLLIPVTAGGFVYIAAADLMPELQHDRTGRGGLVQVSLISLGMGVMGLLAILE